MNDVYANIEIIVKSEGKQIARFRRDYAVPGEMEKIRIPKKLLTGKEIEVFLQGGDME